MKSAVAQSGGVGGGVFVCRGGGVRGCLFAVWINIHLPPAVKRELNQSDYASYSSASRLLVRHTVNALPPRCHLEVSASLHFIHARTQSC